MTARLDDASRALIAHVLADMETRVAEATFHAIAGIPSEVTMNGLYRRVAGNHGCTPEDVKRWWELAKSETPKEPKA